MLINFWQVYCVYKGSINSFCHEVPVPEAVTQSTKRHTPPILREMRPHSADDSIIAGTKSRNFQNLSQSSIATIISNRSIFEEEDQLSQSAVPSVEIYPFGYDTEESPSPSAKKSAVNLPIRVSSAAEPVMPSEFRKKDPISVMGMSDGERLIPGLGAIDLEAPIVKVNLRGCRLLPGSQVNQLSATALTIIYCEGRFIIT